MKFLKFPVLALMLSAVFFSCKKDKDDVPSSIQGDWKGNYGYANDVPSIYFRLNIKSGGVIEELNSSGAVKGSGTWSLNGNVFTAKYQWKAPLNTIFSVKATYDASNNKLSGTWGYNDDPANGGKWENTKSN